ncbi:hypothetical protein GWI33_016337, partial [Rhynchophorus ferrugineus]
YDLNVGTFCFDCKLCLGPIDCSWSLTSKPSLLNR